MNCLVVIPARGGSKGIPRKNLRPLAGKPLIYYSIQAALAAKLCTRVVVSTDDDEIALFAQRFGACVLMRPSEIADDASTLDPVIHYVLNQAEKKFGEEYDVVITVQPTSPLVLAEDIDRTVSKFVADKKLDTVISVVDDRHLCWKIVDGKPAPAYEERVNRQKLAPNYKETGAVIACRRQQLENGSRIGENVALVEIAPQRAFDIDEISDLHLCESMLSRKKIVFNVVGYSSVGMGHAYRATMLAHEMVNFEVHFVCEQKSSLAADYISSLNYPVHVCPDGEMLSAVQSLAPDLVINDILDTEGDFIVGLKRLGCKVVNFEDMGSGYKEADLVVNALYPHKLPSDHVLTGPRYFCLRDEFLHVDGNCVTEDVSRILVTFGGVDEGNLTARVIEVMMPFCKEMGISLDVALGPGYVHRDELDAVVAEWPRSAINVVENTSRISDYMCRSDMAITSGGRTVLELASLDVPSVVICQNRRETTHTFASSENGIINLGYRGDVTDAEILDAVRLAVTDSELRETMCKQLRKLDLSKGKKRVVRIISDLLSRG